MPEDDHGARADAVAAPIPADPAGESRAESPGEQPARILLVRPSALGDVARSVHVLAGLRRAFPVAQIDWLVQAGFEGVVDHHPALNRAIPFDRRGMSATLKRLNVGPLRDLIRTLREPRYDLAVDAQGLLRSAALAWLSGAPRRVGAADAREGAPLLYSRRADAPAALHAVDRMHAIVNVATGGSSKPHPPDLTLYPDPERVAEVNERTGGNPIVLAPTTRWPAKQWPADRWARLARDLLDVGCDPIAIVAAGSERHDCEPALALAREHPGRVLDLVGATDVAGLLALISTARLVVAHDSAAAHITVGTARSLVALFGPTRTDLVGPYQRDADVIQHITDDELAACPGLHKDPAAARITARITADEVTAAAIERLTPSPPSRA